MAEFIFGCNVPFNIVESHYFIKFVSTLNSSYKPPTRKTLSTTLLDKVHDKLEKECAEKLRGTDSVLLMDGWKNSANNTKLVVSTIHNANGDFAFLDCADFTSNSETSEELVKAAKHSIQLAQEKYGSKIYAAVTDNAANMISMGKNLPLWNLTCNSHSGNLVAKDIVDKEFADTIRKVLKEYKSSKLEKELTIRGGKRIKLPCDTRWNSYRDSFECFLENVEFMREIAKIDNFNVKPASKEILEDKSIDDKVIGYLTTFNPICKLVNSCQQLTCNIADAIEEWLSLRFPSHDAAREDILNNRLKKVIHPIGLAANYLHPVYQGQLFKHDEHLSNEAMNFFRDNLNEDGMVELDAYINRSETFSTLLEKKCSAITLWTLAETWYPNLSKLAIKLLNIPASTAQLERLFSNWAFIHSYLRNRLGSDKSKKLVNIYYILRHRDTSKCNVDDMLNFALDVLGK